MRQTTHFKYEMEDVECKFCTEYIRKKGGCNGRVCPWLAERIKASVVGYEETLLDSFPSDPRLGTKLRTTVGLFRSSLWLNEGHRQRMETLKAREGYRPRRDIYASGDGVALTDLADREVIDTEAFCLIVNALLIARYGSQPAQTILAERSDRPSRRK